MDSLLLSAGWEVRDAWVQSVADSLGWGILAWAGVAVTLLFLTQVVVPRLSQSCHFWCGAAEREVEVEFEEHGLPGARRAVSVRSCSVFDPPSAVSCRRACLNRDVRVLMPMSPVLQWRKP